MLNLDQQFLNSFDHVMFTTNNEYVINIKTQNDVSIFSILDINKFVSFIEIVPFEIIILLNFSYHCFSAYFNPYKDFTNVQTFFSCPKCKDPQVILYRFLHLNIL